MYFQYRQQGKTDQLNIVQIEQDMAMCQHKFPRLICKPIAAQFMRDHLIVLFEFEDSKDGVVITSEKHYRLVPSEEIGDDDLAAYRIRSMDNGEYR